MPPRTIDNLGAESYTRYAEDQALFDKAYLSEPGKVVPQAAQDITRPAFTSQFRQLLGITFLHPQWATFLPPTMGLGRQKLLFTSQVLPFMGTTDKKEAQKGRIRGRPDEEREKEERRRKPQWQQDKEDQDLEREKNTLLELFACLEALNDDMITILTKMKQFQKG